MASDSISTGATVDGYDGWQRGRPARTWHRSGLALVFALAVVAAGCLGSGHDDSAGEDPAPTPPPAPPTLDDPSLGPEANGTADPAPRPVETTVSEGKIAYLVAYQEGGRNHSSGLYVDRYAALPASTFEVEVTMTWSAATPAAWRVCLPYFTAPDADVVVLDGTTGCWVGSDGVTFRARFFDGETPGDTAGSLRVFVHDAPTADAAAMVAVQWTVTAFHHV